MVSKALLLALAFRSLSLLLPQTFFQPDEFYQALEPAHHAVFGYGYLSWEWRDLPYSGTGWYNETVVGGRMRSWLWPSVFVGIYKLLRCLGLDETELLVFAPRVVGVIVAASTDYHTYRLAIKVLGEGAGPGALFLSLTSLFNGHALTRSFSNSPETLLTVLALTFFPLPESGSPIAVAVGDKGLVASQSMRNLTAAKSDPKKTVSGDVLQVDMAEHLNYVVMDRMDHVFPSKVIPDNLVLSVVFATLAICIRPTTGPLWLYLGLDYVMRVYRSQGVTIALGKVLTGVVSSLFIIAGSSYLDYTMTGRIVFPILTFVHHNIFANVSSFYGATSPWYHLTQSLPLLLAMIWWWWIKGFIAALCPSQLLPSSLRDLDRPPGLRLLARAVAFGILVLSFSPHSEWRFLHPFLAPMLLFALPPLYQLYVPDPAGLHQLSAVIRQYIRFPARPFYLILLGPLIPWIYLSAFHGRAQAQVVNVLRRGQLGQVTSIALLAPSHSIPWMSHLHKDVPAFMLSQEPPLGVDRKTYRTQVEVFYEAPVSFIDDYLHLDLTSVSSEKPPSHIVLFGELLDRAQDISGTTIRQTLSSMGYEEAWYGWNGFDWAQDEEERRGGVRIWSHHDLQQKPYSHIEL